MNAQLGACQVLAAVLWQSQNENPARARFKWAGSREPSFGQGLCYEGSASQTHGRAQRFLTERRALY